MRVGGEAGPVQRPQGELGAEEGADGLQGAAGVGGEGGVGQHVGDEPLGLAHHRQVHRHARPRPLLEREREREREREGVIEMGGQRLEWVKENLVTLF